MVYRVLSQVNVEKQRWARDGKTAGKVEGRRTYLYTTVREKILSMPKFWAGSGGKM